MPQESNMAELLRLMHHMIGKVDDLTGKFDGLSYDVKEVKSDIHVIKSDVHVLKSDVHVLKSDVHVLKSDVRELKTNAVRVERKLDVLSGQFQDVGSEAVRNTPRITSLEGRIDILERKAN